MTNPLHPKKLLLSKWTAVTPQHKEKHFLVVRLVLPETPDAPVLEIELEAVHSGRSRRVAWRELRDASEWRQGWV
ncbi:TIGR02450 family Trp-rich protein [Paucibacter sp. PLA-PC-4]|uniref:TIGR02450 family Trp-rich protein n=1 Tax=Paucibacter sp. PLA-PC-4 TaxID=2993655 RepID=UPI0022497293|nr:TIGR02450 family Trp-rich protein [Paucibacter sp. PLA-PC-4]MCX2860549.1 TIGR02450 family Trp-rich protein [Paucibacter sp. PLA-PC-4]